MKPLRLSELAAEYGFDKKNAFGRIITLGGGDKFIKAGTRTAQLDEIGIRSEKIVETVRKIAGI